MQCESAAVLAAVRVTNGRQPLAKAEKEDQEADPEPEDLSFDFAMYPFQWKTDACSKEADEG